MRNTSKKAAPARNKPAAVDYAEALDMARKAGAKFRKHERDTLVVVTMAAEAVRVAVDSGYLHLDTKVAKPEGAVNRAQYAKTHFGLANGSLVTFWCTLADALRKGVTTDSALWRVLAGGRNPIGRRGGMADAIGKAADAAQVANAVRAAGFNPETGEKHADTTPRGTSQVAGAKSPEVLIAEAVKVLRANLPKLPKGASPEWLAVRKSILDMIGVQEKARPLPAPAPKAAEKAA